MTTEYPSHQFDAGVRADVARAARNHDGHFNPRVGKTNPVVIGGIRPPMAFIQFCLRYADQCESQRIVFRGSQVRLTAER
jgi:hypothetical protein